jgi:uncharacterized protein Smg (DUF494 family)
MKERIVEILLYLMAEIQGNDRITDLALDALRDRGYSPSEITAALSWLADNGPRDRAAITAARPGSRRLFHEAERAMIPAEGQGLLIQLQELGLLDLRDVETVIDRAMLSGLDRLSLDELREIVTAVLLTRGTGGSPVQPTNEDTIH